MTASSPLLVTLSLQSALSADSASFTHAALTTLQALSSHQNVSSSINDALETIRMCHSLGAARVVSTLVEQALRTGWSFEVAHDALSDPALAAIVGDAILDKLVLGIVRGPERYVTLVQKLASTCGLLPRLKARACETSQLAELRLTDVPRVQVVSFLDDKLLYTVERVQLADNGNASWPFSAKLLIADGAALKYIIARNGCVTMLLTHQPSFRFRCHFERLDIIYGFGEEAPGKDWSAVACRGYTERSVDGVREWTPSTDLCHPPHGTLKAVRYCMHVIVESNDILNEQRMWA